MSMEAKTFINGSDIKIPTVPGTEENYFCQTNPIYTPGTGIFSTGMSTSLSEPTPKHIETAHDLIYEAESWIGKDKEQEISRWELLVKHAQKQIEILKAE